MLKHLINFLKKKPPQAKFHQGQIVNLEEIFKGKTWRKFSYNHKLKKRETIAWIPEEHALFQEGENTAYKMKFYGKTYFIQILEGFDTTLEIYPCENSVISWIPSDDENKLSQNPYTQT